MNKHYYKEFLNEYEFCIFDTSFFINKNTQKHATHFLDALIESDQIKILLIYSITNKLRSIKHGSNIELSKLAINGFNIIDKIKTHSNVFVTHESKKNVPSKDIIIEEFQSNRYQSKILVCAKSFDLYKQIKKLNQNNIHVANIEIDGKFKLCDDNNGHINHSPKKQIEKNQHDVYQPKFSLHHTPAPIGNLLNYHVPDIGEDVIINNTHFRLSNKLNIGGEGSIYSYYNEFVIKIYHKSELRQSRVDKLLFMINQPINHPSIIWPKELVYNNYNQIIGFVMKKATGYTLSELLSEQNLVRLFPDWKKIDLLELIETLLNILLHLHKNNVIVGDLRDSNFIIKDKKTIYIIDTDGFQVNQFNSLKGVPLFTAPEIQGIEYKNIMRSFGNEYFAISVLIFNIMMFDKPYPNIKSSISMTEVERIEKMMFPYSFKDIKPTYQPMVFKTQLYKWSHLPFFIKEIFFKTFSKNGEYSLESTRYSTIQWIEAIEVYKKLICNGKLSSQDPMSLEISPSRKKNVQKD